MSDMSESNALGLNREDFKSLWPRSLGVMLGQVQELVDTVTSETAQSRKRSEDLGIAGQRAIAMAGKIATEIRSLADAIPNLPTAAADAKLLHDLITQLATERAALEETRASVQAKLDQYERERSAVLAKARQSLQDKLSKQGFFWRLAWAMGKRCV